MKMKLAKILPAVMLAILPTAALAASEGAPTTEQQMQSLQAMCATSSAVRADRHAATPLYERLGGYDRIHQLTTEIVRLHNLNDSIKHMFAHVDPLALATHVADFMSAGTGGTAKYSGRDLPSSHSQLELTDADFLSAGGDIIQAMQTMEYGQEEIDEVVCILVSLKDQVVFK